MAIGRIPEPLAGIQEAILDAKGDLISATAADTPARLAVGSNNQILMADSAQSTGLKWAASATSTLTAKGDLLTATAANTIARLGVGADGTTLVADSTQSTGLKWASASSGLTYITGASFSGVSSVSLPTDTFTTTYDNYRILFTVESAASSPTEIRMRMRAAGSDDTSANYAYASPVWNYAGGSSLNNASGVSYWYYTNTSNSTAIYTRVGFDIITPKLAQTTVVNSSGGSGTLSHRTGTFFYDQTTQFDSMTFYVDAGNFTGKYRVYGYQNS